MSKPARLYLRLGRRAIAYALADRAYRWSPLRECRLYDTGISPASARGWGAQRTISTTLASKVSDVMEETMKRIDESPALDRLAARTTWDAIVIGAGPAGALAARQLARAGLQTLLIDAKHFPREKVCGGYLNSRAMNTLR